MFCKVKGKIPALEKQ